MKNIKYCKCGCGEIVTSKTAQYINHHYSRTEEYKKSNRLKSCKSWEEKFGKKYSEKRKKELSLKRKGKIEFMETAIKESHKKTKGKTWNEIYGKERADEIKAKKIINKELIINETKKIFQEYGSLTKKEFYKLIRERCCNEETIRYKFGSSNNLAINANIIFKKVDSSVYDNGDRTGYYEKEILDFIEELLNIQLLRQYRVDKYWVDGYDKDNNVVYEVDERHHKYQKQADLIRENKIKKVLNCKVIRINEKIYVKKIKNSAPKSFEEVMNHGLIQS